LRLEDDAHKGETVSVSEGEGAGGGMKAETTGAVRLIARVKDAAEAGIPYT